MVFLKSVSFESLMYYRVSITYRIIQHFKSGTINTGERSMRDERKDLNLMYYFVSFCVIFVHQIVFHVFAEGALYISVVYLLHVSFLFIYCIYILHYS